MGKINAKWHKENRMPKNATIAEKIKWHQGHSKNCTCRDSAAHLLKMKKLKK
jgi:hypothetical protein